MFIELQAFCIKFMEVPEALSLFKQLKEIDASKKFIEGEQD